MQSLFHLLSRGFYLFRRERPRLVNNPIILRELIVQLRKKQSFFYLFLFLAIGSITFILWWSDYTNVNYYRDKNSFSRDLLLSLSLLEGIILLLFAPLLSATAINLERERETWDLLITTPITMTSILLGKFLSSLFFVWIVMLSILPIFSLTMPVGGVSPTEIFAIFVMFTEGTLIASSIGLFCSIRWKRTIQSITMTYIFSFLYFFLIPLSPLFFTNRPGRPGFVSLSTPIIPVIYCLFPPGMLARDFRIKTDQLGLAIHFALIAVSIAVLVGLCIWQMQPARIQRAKEFFRREAMALEQWMGNVYVLGLMIIVVWIIIAIVQMQYHPLTMQAFWMIITDEFISPFFMTVGVLVFLIFPLIFTVRYQLQWDRESWQDAASTPKQLRRFLFRNLKQPLLLFLRWMVVTSPLIFCSFFFRPITIAQSVWAIFFLGETVIVIAAIVLSCSLMSRSIFKSLCYSYLLLFIVFFFFPSLGIKFGHSFWIATSPVFNAFLPFTKIQWINPVVPLWEKYFYLFCIHFILILLYIEMALFFCERRILVNSGKFERESLWKWFRRNLRNQNPTTQSNPGAYEISFFSDRTNPIKERECRDFTHYHHSSFVKSLIGLFLASATLFLFLPVMNENYFREFFARDGLVFPLVMTVLFIPFFIIPYAANSFRKEHDQSTWTLLATTTLTPLQIVTGKLRAALWVFHRRFFAMAIPILFLLAGFFGVLKIEPSPNKQHLFAAPFFVYGLAIIYAYALLYASFATFVSARASKTVTAYLLPLIAAYLVQSSPIFFELAGFHWSEYRHIASILSPCCLLTETGMETPFWYLCFQTQLAINVFFCLVFIYLTYHALRRSVERE